MCLLIYPVRDLEAHKKLFRAMLGVEPYVEGSQYAGFRTGQVEIGLDPNGASTGPVAYYPVADIRVSLQRLLDAGGELVQDVRTVGPGRQIALVRDAAGSTVGILQDS